MIPLQLTIETRRQFDSLKATFTRASRPFMDGGTNTVALEQADLELAEAIKAARELRIYVRGEIGDAKARAREDAGKKPLRGRS